MCCSEKTRQLKRSLTNAKFSRWMNPRPQGRNPYNPTILEHYANIVTHGLSIFPSCIGAYYMAQYSRTHEQYKSTLIYGISLILVFTVSTLFHFFSLSNDRRATIYVFIASSYTPWLYLRSTTTVFGQYMFLIVWIGAFLGIAYQIIFHERYKILEIIFYLVIGVCPSIVVLDMVDVTGLEELAIGGALYVTGILFFKSDGLIPFAHAIWHLFVSMGASIHYYAIFNYLLKD